MKKRRILALGAHPDDIEYGCGGTLLKYAALGHEIHLYVLTDGSKAGDPDVRRAEQEAAAGMLGASSLHWGGFTDAELPGDHALIQSMERVIHDVRPDELYFHHDHDTHQDHRKLSRAALVASRTVHSVFYFDGWSTIHFSPTVYVDIADQVERKKELLACHRSQTERELMYNQNKIGDAVEAMGRFRGLQAKITYAEAFLPVRHIRDLG